MPPESDPVSLTPPVSTRDHLRGRSAAPMTLVQFGDYACPHCTEAHPIVRQLMEATAGKLRFVYRHYPTVSPLSRRAAEITEAVAKDQGQDAFWTMHDLLSAMDGELEEADVYGAAEAAGLCPDDLRANQSQGPLADRVEEDLDSARQSGVTGTPTFFVNGTRYDASLNAEDVLAELKLGDAQQSIIARAYMQRLEAILGRAGLF